MPTAASLAVITRRSAISAHWPADADTVCELGRGRGSRAVRAAHRCSRSAVARAAQSHGSRAASRDLAAARRRARPPVDGAGVSARDHPRATEIAVLGRPTCVRAGGFGCPVRDVTGPSRKRLSTRGRGSSRSSRSGPCGQRVCGASSGSSPSVTACWRVSRADLARASRSP